MENQLFDCSVCFEQTPVTELVVCPANDVSHSKVCLECTKKYILSTSQLAHCMVCKMRWSYKFLNSLDKAWSNDTRKGYRKHRKEIALDREKSKIPKTLLSAEFKDFKLKIKLKAELKELETQKSSLLVEIRKIDSELKVWKTESELDDLLDSKTLHQKKLYRIKREIKIKKELMSRFLVDDDSNKNSLICACPIEDCRGLVNSFDYKCIVCDVKVCKKCWEVLKDNHTCDVNNIKNINQIKKSSRACPKCGTRIHKISGCDQMWCVECHTTFSYRTGKLNNDRIHNPHAIAWLRRTRGEVQRDIDDVPCGDLPPINSVLGSYHSNKIYKSSLIQSIYVVMAEINEKLRNHLIVDNFDRFRMKYLTNQIDEKQWQRAIFRLERDNERRFVITDILTTLRHLGIERFRNLVIQLLEIEKIVGFKKRNKLKLDLCVQFIQEMEEIRQMVNTTFEEELKLLGSRKVLQITKENNKKELWHWSF